MVEPQLGEFDRIGLGLNRLTSDRALQIKLQQREIVARPVADEGPCDDLASLFGSQELGAGCFVGAAQAAEEIQLERRVGRQSQEVVPGLNDMFFSAAEIGVT